VSTNKIYEGIHWTKRRKIKDSFHDYARVFCRPLKQNESYPVEITYRFFFVTRPLDTLNTAFMAKMFEDSLCTLGVIKDDNLKYVKRSILEVAVVPRQKNKKGSATQREKTGEEITEDFVEISINNLN